MPTPQAISRLLSMIFGNELNVSDCASPELGSQHVATFIDDSDQLVALCVCDKSFVAYAGAALSMIPADVANEMIGGSALPDAMVGNFHEVMNICSKLLMSNSSAHLRLGEILNPEASAETVTLLQESAHISGFGVDVPRYGKGTLAFVVT
jgi:hypothetical protein